MGKQTQVMLDRTVKRRWCTAPIKGEGDSRGVGAEYSL